MSALLDVNASLLEQVKSEIDSLETTSTDQVLVSYSEFQTTFGFPFRVSFIEDQRGLVRVLYRKWDINYDSNRAHSAAISIDNLRIVADIFLLDDEQKECLKAILEATTKQALPSEMKAEEQLSDGCTCALDIHYNDTVVNYEWNGHATDFKLVEKLIAYCMELFDELSA